MYCSRCGKKVLDEMLYCPFCGAKIIIPDQSDDEGTPEPESDKYSFEKLPASTVFDWDEKPEPEEAAGYVPGGRGGR